MPVILLLEDGRGSLRCLVYRDWRDVVQAQDIGYIESVLDDLRERAALDSEALFRQLSSLETGPLLTQSVGSNLADYPSIEKLLPRFEQL